MAFVTGFARRTGDLQVLSKPDLQLLALTYELEVERNGGDVWRLSFGLGYSGRLMGLTVALEERPNAKDRERKATDQAGGDQN